MKNKKDCFYKKTFYLVMGYFVSVLFVAAVIGIVGIILKLLHVFKHIEYAYVASTISAIIVLYPFIKYCVSKSCYTQNDVNPCCEKID